MTPSLQRWQQLCLSLGLSPDAAEFQRIRAAYSEPHRAYHNLGHLDECLGHLDWARESLPSQKHNLIELALWYHDVVYQIRRSDNEARSAAEALDFAGDAGLEKEPLAVLEELILATDHQQPPANGEQALIVDIDLAILGSSEARFSEYQQQIRAEYRWVPWFLYRKKRAEILNLFLKRARIYQTSPFYEQYEKQARSNLSMAIKALS